jgi:uncharacterized membrane protein YqjE
LRSRTRDLAERRPTLVKLLIAIFVARMVVTVVEMTEQRLTLFSLLITAAIGVEAWRAWSVSRVARDEPGEQARAPASDTAWDRLLRPLERTGPAVIYGLTGVFVVAAVVLLVLGDPHDRLLDIAVVCRELTTFVFVGVILAAYMSMRRAR